MSLAPEMATLIRGVAAYISAVAVKIDQTLLHPDHMSKWENLARPKPKAGSTPKARAAAPDEAA